MAHSVTITTPMPTWEETVERYRLSKADQKFVASLFDDEKPRLSTAYAFKPLAAASKSAKGGTKKTSGVAGKSISRARKTA